MARDRFHYLPVVPGRLEFALEVRRAILGEKPQAVAVELPATVEAAYLDAIKRLPKMTVLLYTDEKAEDQAIYIVVEPADPFTEAVRSALEIGAEVVFADPDLGERPHLPDNYPDPYSIPHVGMEKYVEAYRIYPQPRSDAIATHAAGIAWKLQGTDPEGRTLVVLSLNLLDPVLDAMEEPQPQPLARAQKARRGPAEPASRLPRRDRRRVPVSPGAVRAIPRRDGRPRSRRQAPRATRAASRRGKGLRKEHRRARGILAQAPR